MFPFVVFIASQKRNELIKAVDKFEESRKQNPEEFKPSEGMFIMTDILTANHKCSSGDGNRMNGVVLIYNVI